MGHSHSLDVGTPGNDSRMPATGRSVSVNDDGLGMAVNSSEVFVPKVGSSLIFQESTSQDVLCVDTRSPECKCVVSSTRSAAIFKVASVATHEKNGDLVALQCTSLRKGAAAAAAGTAAGKGTHTSGADDGSLLYFSDINQKLHCRSADRTPLWQLVELRDDVVNGRRAQEATYVLRVVAQWWFPAVILRRCNPPSDAVFLDSAGRERLYSVNYTGSGSDTTTSLGANTNANANAAAAAGNMGGAAQTSSGTAAPVEDSPATAAFNRLQNNVDNGFSSSFEASFAESDEVSDAGQNRIVPFLPAHAGCFVGVHPVCFDDVPFFFKLPFHLSLRCCCWTAALSLQSLRRVRLLMIPVKYFSRYGSGAEQWKLFLLQPCAPLRSCKHGVGGKSLQRRYAYRGGF